MEELRQSQQALAESARRLRQMMNQKSDMIPGLQGEPMKSLDQAQNSMGRAENSLGKSNAGHAQAEQTDALSQLKGLMKGLKQASQPQSQRQQAGQSGQNGRRKSSSEKVKIPTAEDHSAPVEFRKELMDAMKEKPPEAYRESVRRYYESWWNDESLDHTDSRPFDLHSLCALIVVKNRGRRAYPYQRMANW